MMLWNAFYDVMLTELPGVPTNLVDLHLKLSAIEFLDETHVWVVTADPVDIVANTATYSLVAPAAITHADVAQVKVARFGGVPLTFITQDELRQSSTDLEAETNSSPRGFTQYADNTLTLIPPPSVALTAGLTMKLAIVPDLTATGVEDWIGGKWFRDIAAGAKAELMGMADKPWSNATRAKDCRAQFEAAKTRATIEANRGLTRATSQIQLKRY